VRPPDDSPYTEVADLTVAAGGQSGSWSYTPTLLPILGEHQLTVSVVDVNGNELPLHDWPTFVLLGVNSPPEANTDTFATSEKTPLTNLDVLTNDSDPDGDDLALIAVVSAAEYGIAALEDSQVNYDPNGVFDWLPTGEPATDTFTYTITDGNNEFASATVTILVTGVNDVPVIDDTAPAPQSVQYSDGIQPMTLQAADVDATEFLSASILWVRHGDGTTFPVGLAIDEVGMQLAAPVCEGSSSEPVSCAWIVSGAARLPAGVYDLQFTVSDGEDETIQTFAEVLTVSAENARPVLDDNNPGTIQVAVPGGTAQDFTLWLDVTELFDAATGLEPAGEQPHPGDTNLAELLITLEPVGPGPLVGPITCSNATTVAAYDYNSQLRIRCDFPASMNIAVNTYTVVAQISGDHYQGMTEGVVVIYDPSLGAATGGGWFYWPGTADPVTDYPGDKTNFGFNMKYIGNGKNVQGNLLLIRHLPDGTIYRLKSNVINSLALGTSDNPSRGWATINGKNTYLEPGWEEPEGNYSFIMYVEDRNEPGGETDRIWLEVTDKNGTIVSAFSLAPPATDHAVSIKGGNIAVPH